MTPQMAAFSASVPLSRKTRSDAARCARMCSKDAVAEAAAPEDAAAAVAADAGKAVGPAKYQPIRTVKSTASWRNTYIEEFGRKGPGSRPDFDLRPRSLRETTLSAKDAATCAYCEGTGLRMCSFCEGIEFISDGKVSKCPACKGKSQVTCSTCFGTAKQIELKGNWWSKGIANLFQEQ